jgi:hypothetical protein
MPTTAAWCAAWSTAMRPVAHRRPPIAQSLSRVPRGLQTAVVHSKNLPKIRKQKVVKLTGCTFACNSLTDFEYEYESPELEIM